MVVIEMHSPHEADHSHDVYTVANMITVVRFMMVPFFLSVFLSERSDGLAFVIFAVAAATDWVDGQIARHTGTVTEIGKAFDPLVDRMLIAAGVVGLFLEGRLPLWIVALLLTRDLYLLMGAGYLARVGAGRVDVVFIGKLTTALLLAGFSGLILGVPTVPGAGVIDASWLPGLGAGDMIVWMYFVYAGIITSLMTAVIYTGRAAQALRTHAGTR